MLSRRIYICQEIMLSYYHMSVALSLLGVVLELTHGQDADLRRCFGDRRKVIDCDWEELSKLRTLRSPHEPMPRLRDLLELVAQPELQHLWLLLDIKVDNDADNVMRLIAETIKSVPPGARPWNDRILLGIWAAKFLPLCVKYSPGFPITHIGFSTCYARQFLKVPNVSFNIMQKVLLGPVGKSFIRDVKKAGRPLFIWTVNQAHLMKWGIQKELDGIITDDPKKFREVCDEWDDDEPPAHPSWAEWLSTFWLYMIIGTFWFRFKYRFPETVDQYTAKETRKTRYGLRLSG